VVLSLVSRKAVGAIAAGKDLAASLHIALATDGFSTCRWWRFPLNRSSGRVR
jgi:hypothetical protein